MEALSCVRNPLAERYHLNEHVMQTITCTNELAFVNARIARGHLCMKSNELSANSHEITAIYKAIRTPINGQHKTSSR